MKEEKETPKTYYEKILVSSGEVPEQDKLKGEYVFIQKDGSITSLIFPCWMPEGFYEEHFESWLKPVPSPKQEVINVLEWLSHPETDIDLVDSDFYWKSDRDGDQPMDAVAISELYDKFKLEKGD